MKILCPYCKTLSPDYLKINSKHYCKCRACGLIFQKKQPYIRPDWYQRNYFQQYAADQITGSRRELYLDIVNEIGKYMPPGRLLDVGTGCGFFPAIAQKQGWQVKGIDPSRQSVEVARSMGTDVFQGTLEEYRSTELFDVISFVNVLDQMEVPWEALAQARQMLRPGGMIFIRFPNGFFHSSIFRMASFFRISEYILKYLVFHKYVFTPRFVSTLLNDSGFTHISLRNSVPARGDPYKLFSGRIRAHYIRNSIWKTARALFSATSGKILLGTSLHVTAHVTAIRS